MLNQGLSYQLPCCTGFPWWFGTNWESGAIPQEFGLISSVGEIPLNHVNLQHHQEMKLQKRLKVSKQNEMKRLPACRSETLWRERNISKCKWAALLWWRIFSFTLSPRYSFKQEVVCHLNVTVENKRVEVSGCRVFTLDKWQRSA